MAPDVLPLAEGHPPAHPAGFAMQAPDAPAPADAAQARSRMLTDLLRRVLQLQEFERRQVVHLLHDELAQILAAIKIRLQLPMPDDHHRAAASDGDTMQMIDDALLLVRRIVPSLRPAILDDLGLVPALRDLALHTEARTRMPVSVQCQPSEDPFRLEPELASAAFRVVQEALTNVERHANATRIDILLRRNADTMWVEVCDDGCGFQASTAPHSQRDGPAQGMGLLLMRERAVALGATLEIESVPGQGCCVRLLCLLGPSPAMQ